MAKITKKDTKEINRIRNLFPRVINVQIDRSEDGGFCAEVKTFPGCLTEANSFSELIEMVNDAVRIYLDVPTKYMPFAPNYLPPLEAAQRLNVFPIKEKHSKIEFIIPNRERAAR